MKPKTKSLAWLAPARWLALLLAIFAPLAPWDATAESSGSFSAMTTVLPNGFTPGHMLLLPDGRVMVQQSFGSNWMFLLPDNQGHYGDGTWQACPTMHYSREYYSSDILTNGEVFVAGGEDGNGGATAEIFNPQANNGQGSWTTINPPTSLINPANQSPALLNGNQEFSDSDSVILPNGNILIAPVGPNQQGGTLIYNPTANSWSAGPLTEKVFTRTSAVG
jgi:hypothetical protein